MLLRNITGSSKWFHINQNKAERVEIISGSEIYMKPTGPGRIFNDHLTFINTVRIQLKGHVPCLFSLKKAEVVIVRDLAPCLHEHEGQGSPKAFFHSCQLWSSEDAGRPHITISDKRKSLQLRSEQSKGEFANRYLAS